jgi:hypothetical protein
VSARIDADAVSYRFDEEAVGATKWRMKRIIGKL